MSVGSSTWKAMTRRLGAPVPCVTLVPMRHRSYIDQRASKGAWVGYRLRQDAGQPSSCKGCRRQAGRWSCLPSWSGKEVDADASLLSGAFIFLHRHRGRRDDDGLVVLSVRRANSKASATYCYVTMHFWRRFVRCILAGPFVRLVEGDCRRTIVDTDLVPSVDGAQNGDCITHGPLVAVCTYPEALGG